MLHVQNLVFFLVLSITSAWAAPMCSLRAASASASSPSASPTVAGGLGNGKGGGGGGSGNGNSNNTLPENVVATTWYAGWHGTDLPPDKLSWSKYTSVTYAFALTTPDVNTVSLEASDESLLPTFVSAAHQNNVKALLTIGGWTGSQYFSTSVGSSANRTAFVKTCVNLVKKYDLDGLDFDWEYPGKQGMGCNIVNPQDSDNFLSFLQLLRADPTMKSLLITAATSIEPFIGTDGSPKSDVSEFAKVFDFIAIMNYDVWGAWSSSVGPNAPLNDTCSQNPEGSAVSAVKAWTAAGFPANQLVLGVASYGHSFSVQQSAAFASTSSDGSSSVSALPAGTKAIAAYPPFDASVQPLGDSWDEVAPAGVDQCGNPTNGGPSGIYDFWGLIQDGYLTSNGTAAAGMGFRFDTCSQTPYVYNPTKQEMVSYDDPQSFAAKGQFINEAGLLGFAMWEAAGDYQDMLLDSISNAMGLESKKKAALSRRAPAVERRAISLRRHLRRLWSWNPLSQ